MAFLRFIMASTSYVPENLIKRKLIGNNETILVTLSSQDLIKCFSYRETISIDVIVTVEYNSQFIGIVQNQLARKLTAAKFLHIAPIPALRYFVVRDDLNTNYTIIMCTIHIWIKITYGHRGNTYRVSKLCTHKRGSPSYNTYFLPLHNHCHNYHFVRCQISRKS